MKIGILARVDAAELDMVARLGFGCIEWVRFNQHDCHSTSDWKDSARKARDEAGNRGLIISAIGALYANPLDPAQTASAHHTFTRAIEVAGELGIRTMSCFPGMIIRTTLNERGGNPVYAPPEESIPALLAFWEPLAEMAAAKGVRIAFEHCPQGPFHLPVMGYNALATPAMWERFFNATKAGNIGIEWDPAHLICQFIEPLENLRKFGSKVFHVHAKDAFIDTVLLKAYGICHPQVAEHRFPGFGQSDWAQIIHALVRTGYDSDLNIEGWHDPVFRNHPKETIGPLGGRQLEEAGLMVAKRLLENLVNGIS